MARIDLPYTFLDCDVTGSGDPVVLSPGLAGLSGFWSKQLPVLAANHQVITYDHRGCGKSSRDPAPVSVETMAHDLIGLLDALHIPRASIVGHSTGGAICQYLAAHAPDRINKIVISCSWTSCDPYMRQLFYLRKRVLETCGVEDYGLIGSFFLYPPRHLHEHPEILGPKQQDMPELFAQTSKQRIDAILKFDSRPYLDRISVPTLVIGAHDDALTPAYFSQELASSIAGAELTLLPYGGHYCPVIATGEYNDAIARFLRN